jgi:RimJ/RimL family protein N-acetyltransferase
MITAVLSVREINKDDIDLITQYWTTADDKFLVNMGVDLNKMPAKEFWCQMLSEQLSQSYEEKKSYCIIWQVNGKAIGHSNVNKIIFGEEASMHLHIWNAEFRKSGYGTEFIKMTIPWFFQNLRLRNLYCEPYTSNPAPNKTLEKAGFEFVRNYITTPGFLNFEQEVSRWQMTYEKFKTLQ